MAAWYEDLTGTIDSWLGKLSDYLNQPPAEEGLARTVERTAERGAWGMFFDIMQGITDPEVTAAFRRLDLVKLSKFGFPAFIGLSWYHDVKRRRAEGQGLIRAIGASTAWWGATAIAPIPVTVATLGAGVVKGMGQLIAHEAFQAYRQPLFTQTTDPQIERYADEVIRSAHGRMVNMTEAMVSEGPTLPYRNYMGRRSINDPTLGMEAAMLHRRYSVPRG